MKVHQQEEERTLSSAVVYVDTSKEKWSSKIGWAILTIVIAFGSAWFGAWLNNQGNIENWNQQQNTYKQNVAQALYFDVKNVQNRFDTLPPEVELNKSGTVTISFETEPYYNTQSGIYFIFTKDIASFDDANLSSNLYNYYNLVLLIEDERSQLQQIGNKYIEMVGKNNSTPVHFSDYDRMAISTSYHAMYINTRLAKQNEEMIIERFNQDYKLNEPQPSDYFGQMFNLNITNP